MRLDLDKEKSLSKLGMLSEQGLRKPCRNGGGYVVVVEEPSAVLVAIDYRLGDHWSTSMSRTTHSICCPGRLSPRPTLFFITQELFGKLSYLVPYSGPIDSLYQRSHMLTANSTLKVSNVKQNL